MAIEQSRCFFVDSSSTPGHPRWNVTKRPFSEFPSGELVLRVQYSSLNYKDALAAEGHPGVVKQLPHVPGIDAAGLVEESSDARFQPGQAVLVTGYDLGAPRWGGWSDYIRVPSDWIVPLPIGLTARESMILGTAGFTAAQCVLAFEKNDLRPDAGEIVVTGATGGVGCLAVMILAKLGYQVVASTGKAEVADRLKSWGAARIIDRAELHDTSSRPLLSAKWAGAVDTVGGATLTTLLRSTKNYGVVSACGLVGGADLPLTVHPFILRGVTLAGIASAALPQDRRLEIWRRLSGPWKPANLESIATTVGLDELPEAIHTIKSGQVVGRTLVDLSR
jgi:putative YhdH/YhfP family quinone oxidoreductase